MSNNHPAVDQLYTWKGFGNPPGRELGKWESRCRLRIYNREAAPVIIIVTDDRNSTGTSVTSSAANLAREITKLFKVQPQNFTWLEHYAATPEGETFARVAFNYNASAADGLTFHHPKWTHLTRAEAIELTGDANL